MKLGWMVGLAIGIVAGGAALAPAQVSSVKLLKVDAVTLDIRNRVWPDFHEEARVRLKEEFPVGDTDFSARVVEFVPDFSIDMKTRKVRSLSNEPRNPAVRIIVRQKGAPQDTTWAFLNFPPHFSRKSILAFQIKRLDFTDRPPLVAPSDSTTKGTKP